MCASLAFFSRVLAFFDFLGALASSAISCIDVFLVPGCVLQGEIDGHAVGLAAAADDPVDAVVLILVLDEGDDTTLDVFLLKTQYDRTYHSYSKAYKKIGLAEKSHLKPSD